MSAPNNLFICCRFSSWDRGLCAWPHMVGLTVARTVGAYYISVTEAIDFILISALTSDKIPYYCECNDAEVMVDVGTMDAEMTCFGTVQDFRDVKRPPTDIQTSDLSSAKGPRDDYMYLLEEESSQWLKGK